MTEFQTIYRRLSGGIRLWLLMLAMAVACNAASAQTLLAAKDANPILTQAVKGYASWNSAEMSGKLSASMLPVSVSAKIYMERGKLVIISLRVPLLGEQARVEIDPQNVLIVNKMSGTYCQVPMSEVDNTLPDALDAVQSVLLGRLILLGVGELSTSNLGSAEVYRTSGGEYIVMPAPSAQTPEAGYGYLLDAARKIASFAVAARGNTDSIVLDYNYPAGGGMAVDVQASLKRKNYTGQLSLDAPKWNVKAMERADVSGRYKKVGVRDIFK